MATTKTKAQTGKNVTKPLTKNAASTSSKTGANKTGQSASAEKIKKQKEMAAAKAKKEKEALAKKKAAEKIKKEKEAAAAKVKKEKEALAKKKAAEKIKKEKEAAAAKVKKEKEALAKKKAAEKIKKEKEAAAAKAKKEKEAAIAKLKKEKEEAAKKAAAEKMKKEKHSAKGKDAQANSKFQKETLDDDDFSEADVEDGDFEPLSEEKQQLFDKKIRELLQEARKKKNVLDLVEIKSFFTDLSLNAAQMDLVLDQMEQAGVDVFRMADPEEDLPDNDDLIITEEEEQDLENVDLTPPEGISTDDPVRMYLKEIGKVPLLTGEQEVIYAQQIEAGVAADRVLYGDKIKDKNKDKSDDPDKNVMKDKTKESEESEALRIKREAELVKGKTRKQLLEMSATGKEASSRLAEANLRLVVSIAKRYVGRGMLFLDLIQEGNLGLIKAVEKFDFRKGFKFSTYATWWIRQAITRAIADQARTIRIPVHMVETINKLVRTSRNLLQELGREPTPEEIAKEMGIDVSKVRDIQKISQEPVSLETPIGEEEDSHLGDFLMDDKVPIPIEAASASLLREMIREVLYTLTEREQKVLRLRFGLDDGRSRTLEEVGREFNVTRERIRQIEAKALRKLRHPSRSRKLKDYLD